ncbi:Wzz/FepE/Etk N-terminal domain-containing protein [Gammaproteobacteria bacterium]|nr:Wzz/FepE/Etk N-terminal domain-containing protein [Gammaproteobacteria bacterium]
MENSTNLNPINFDNDQIDFKELFYVLLYGKWIFLSVVSFFSLAAIIYSLQLPNIYQSSALLSPVDAQNGMNQAMRNYGGLANIAGINLQSQAGDSNTIKAEYKLRTLSFFEDNILPNIFLPDLLAVESWDMTSNTISYKNDIYDEEKQSWVRDFSYPQTQIPSAQEAFVSFMENLKISTDLETGFVKLSIKHQSPFIAKSWTELVVKEINEYFRIKDKAEAQAAVKYLNMQIAQTSFTEIKQVIAELLQQKTQQLTLIEASDFYVFEYIDPPAVMERKSEPRRAIICVLGALIGVIISIIVILIRHYVVNKKI